MGKLVDSLTAPEKQQAVLSDAVKLVEEEVDSKGGLSGLAIKGAFMVVQKVKHDFVRDALARLLPDFAARLEPFYDERQSKAPSEPMERFLSERKGEVADALLSITDARAARAKAGPVRSAYEKLRPAARRNVEDAVPRLGRLVDRHVG